MKPKRPKAEPESVFEWKREVPLVIPILLFCLITRLINLGYPDSLYFDEVYHGYTAQLMAQGDPKAYDEFAKAPAGFSYEWSHPYLGKLILTATIKLLGNSVFNLRLSSALFGTIAVFLTWLLAWEGFRKKTTSSVRWIALVAAGLLSLDGLFLAQSRIAMIDTHLLVFELLAFLFYLRYRARTRKNQDLLLAGFFISCALSTKWSAAYLALLLALDSIVDFFIHQTEKTNSKIVIRIIAFIALPISVYLLTYLQYFSLGYTWNQFVALQQHMWIYHTTLTSTHIDQSKPIEWILNLKPVWYYWDRTSVGQSRTIYNLGNSFVVIGGLVACIIQTRRMLLKWNWVLVMFLLGYFISWVPWMFSPRIMFSYHFIPALPFMCLAFSYSLEKLWSLSVQTNTKSYWSPKNKVRFYLAACILFFVVFYPRNTGLGVPRWVADKIYEVIPSWK